MNPGKEKTFLELLDGYQLLNGTVLNEANYFTNTLRKPHQLNSHSQTDQANFKKPFTYSEC